MTPKFVGIDRRSVSSAADSMPAVLTFAAPCLKMYLSIERTNHPRSNGQSNGQKRIDSQSESRLTSLTEPDAVVAKGTARSENSGGIFVYLKAVMGSAGTRPTTYQQVEGTYSMATNDTNPNTSESASKPILYCCCCGMPAKVDWQQDYINGGGYWLVTCLQSKHDCAIGEATASIGSIDNGAFVRAWKVQPLFDVRSGKAVA